MNYQVNNIKVSFKINPICLDTVLKYFKEKNINHKKFVNFLVFSKQFTYILFKTSKANNNHLNITKLKCLEDIEKCSEELETIFKKNIELKIFSKTVDNITVSYHFEKIIPIKQTIEKLKLEKDFKISYNSEKFPGIFIKSLFGTAILFHTGKCILIGCKKISEIDMFLLTLDEKLKTN